MEYKFSNKIDIFALKRNEVANYERLVVSMAEVAGELLKHTYTTKACPVCGGDQLDTVMVLHGFRFQQCWECTHVHNSNIIYPEHLEAFYTNSSKAFAYGDTYFRDENVQTIRKESAAIPKIDYVCSFLDGKKGKWLDIACGNGDLLRVAQDRGFEVTGIELNPQLAEVARESGIDDVFQGTLLDFYKANKGNRYDVVSFVGIISSLPDVSGYMEAASAITSPGGLLATTFANYNSLTCAIQKMNPNHTFRFAYPNVFQLFTEESLARLLRQNGFEPIGTWLFGMDIYELINSYSLGSVQFGNSEARQILIRLFDELQHVIDANRYSDSGMVVAEKTG